MINFNSLKRCFVVAEISANHNQSFDRAVSLIREAKRCGADAVKFQTYTPDTMTLDMDNRYFRIKHPRWGSQTLYQLYEKAYTPWSWFKKLNRIAKDLGIIFFSTAFDKSSVDFLEGLGVAVHKVASFELVDLPLIEYASRTGKPLILSTGMATLPEINEAIDAARQSGAKSLVLLRCVSDYPAAPKEMNLRTIADMKRIFKCPVGISDHTLGMATSIAAVSFGARVVEKHFTLSRKRKGPDSFFSIEPREMKELVSNIRIAEEALGRVHYGPTKEEKMSLIFRRSLFAVKDIAKGEALTEENVRSIRPGYGLLPKYLYQILGRKAKRAIPKGTPLRLKMIGDARKA